MKKGPSFNEHQQNAGIVLVQSVMYAFAAQWVNDNSLVQSFSFKLVFVWLSSKRFGQCPSSGTGPKCERHKINSKPIMIEQDPVQAKCSTTFDDLSDHLCLHYCERETDHNSYVYIRIYIYTYLCTPSITFEYLLLDLLWYQLSQHRFNSQHFSIPSVPFGTTTQRFG